MSKTPTQKEIAEHIGISVRATQKHLSRGMPKTSIEAAHEWYQLNVAHSLSMPPAARKEAEMMAVIDTKGVAPLSLSDQLECLNQQSAFQKLKMEAHEKDTVNYRAWLQMFTETNKQALAVSAKIVEIQTKAAEVIRMEDARNGIMQAMEGFLSHLDIIADRATADMRGKEKARVKAAIQTEIDYAKNALHDWEPE